MGDTGTVLLRGLSDLPDELLTQILDTMLSNRDVWNMCLVNRRMNELADAVLHKNILFDQPRHHLTFSESLIRRPRRGSLIQHVRLEYPSSELTPFELMSLEDNHNRVDRLSHAIATMSNLEDLVVSVPETLCKGIGTVFNGPFDLPNLKTCSLFYQREDGGYWDLQENIHIFSHPNLESLTIRHAKLDERGFESLEKPEMTALKELNLLECDINDDALSDLLLHPEALKEITITQLPVPNPPLEESSDDIEDYITALRSAQHSLETITIDFPTLGAENALRLRDFEVLRELQLRDFQLFGQKTPRLHSVGLPSNMEVLEFLNEVGEDEEIVDLLQYTIENRAIVARKWTHFVVPGGEEGLPKVIADACEKSDIQVL